MSLILQGVAKGLIKLDDEQKYITYIHQNKKKNYTNPEEQVQAETFLKLILTYGYDTKRIRLFVPVTMGSSVKEADIIVYNDDQCLSPHIVVECKKQDVSEAEFTQAVEQAFSYAVAEGAKFVWVTSANYVGRFLKYLENEPREHTSFVGELICIRAKQEICNPIYLYSLLNTALYKDLLNREKTGQTSHIYPKDIQRINIPAPPLAKQDEIADHITAIRNQAKQLRQAASAELKQAKQEVEAMILGERGNK